MAELAGQRNPLIRTDLRRGLAALRQNQPACQKGSAILKAQQISAFLPFYLNHRSTAQLFPALLLKEQTQRVQHSGGLPVLRVYPALLLFPAEKAHRFKLLQYLCR